MEKYPSNSYKSQRQEESKQQTPAVEEKRVQKVVTSPVKTRKKSEIKKFADVFIAEDFTKVKKYVFEEVLIPSAKKLFSEMVTNTVDMLLYGEAGRSRRSNGTPVSRVSYDKMYDNRKEYRTPTYQTYNYDEVSIRDRGDAEMVLSEMHNTLARYGMVKVADFYDFVGITGDHTSYDYGWTNLDGARLVRVSDGWVIKLPKALPID